MRALRSPTRPRGHPSCEPRATENTGEVLTKTRPRMCQTRAQPSGGGVSGSTCTKLAAARGGTEAERARGQLIAPSHAPGCTIRRVQLYSTRTVPVRPYQYCMCLPMYSECIGHTKYHIQYIKGRASVSYSYPTVPYVQVHVHGHSRVKGKTRRSLVNEFIYKIYIQSGDKVQ